MTTIRLAFVAVAVVLALPVIAACILSGRISRERGE